MAAVESEVVVICAGGGGIPVAFDDTGGVRGVEAVIDKDRAAALLARDLAADALVLFTDIPVVYANYGTAQARAIRRISPSSARQSGQRCRWISTRRAWAGASWPSR